MERGVLTAAAVADRPVESPELVITDRLLTDLAAIATGGDSPERRAADLAARLAADGVQCAIWRLDGEATLTVAAAGEAAALLGRNGADGWPPAARRGETVRCSLEQDLGLIADERRERLREAGLRELLWLPLTGRQGAQGVLVMATSETAEWDEVDGDRLDLLAGLAGRVLDDDGHVGTADWNEVFRAAVLALHLDRDADDVCQRAVQQLRQILGPDWVMVARWEGAGQPFDCHLPVTRLSLMPDEATLLHHVVTSRQPVDCVEAGANDELAQRMRAAGIVCCLTMPLIFQGQIYGAVQLGYREPNRITGDVRYVAEQLTFHLALALRDAALLRTQEQALQQLRQAQQDLLQGAKFRALAQMAGGVAHEFNNALGGILARAQMLLRQTQDARVVKGLTTISEIGWRAAETVRRLQAFTRERSEDDFEPIEAGALWRRLADAVRTQVEDYAHDHGERFHVELQAEELRGVVQANAEELIEAVGNVVYNALEATSGGGLVALYAATVADHFHLTVVDRGRGMSSEELQSCFDPFFSSKAETGVGLGLSVTYGIIARHRGEVEIDSAVGQGTTVSLSLPLLPAQPAVVDTRTHVLVIDDEAALCEVLAELFSTAGYEVDCCAGGREGIDRYQASHYDLVCTDLRTEDLSGWEVIRAVKEAGRQTPVLLLTGFREQLKQDQIEESGVDAVLGKPFTLQQVLDTAQRLLPQER